MKTFLDIRPRPTPHIAPAIEFSRALTPIQPQRNNQKNSAEKKIILQDANSYGKSQQDQFTRAQRNLAIAALLRTGEIRQITADDLLHHANLLRGAQNGGPTPFVQVKVSPQKISS